MTNAQIPDRFLIRHQTGTKAHQTDEFIFRDHAELSFGRAVTCAIRFDSVKDDVVSREHGSIRKDPANPLQFTLTDNNSRNGLFLNKNRIAGTVPLRPGDEVQVGANGPVFVFDIDPRPADMIASTRLMTIPASGHPTEDARPTNARVSAAESASVMASLVNAVPARQGPGYQTVERMVIASKRQSQTTVMAIVVAVLTLAGGAGFYLYRQDKQADEARQTARDRATQAALNQQKADLIKQINSVPVVSGMQAEKIAMANNDKVVLVEFAWQLFEVSTGTPLVHEYTAMKDEAGNARYVALYIRNDEGKIEPKLNLQGQAMGLPIGVKGASGSGFIVGEDGYILTNRHVAAGWGTRFNFPESAFPGLLVSSDGRGGLMVDPNTQIGPDDVQDWVPNETRMLGGKPLRGKRVEGRNNYLDVTFADDDLRTPAQVVRVSNEHDVTMIKINMPQKQAVVAINDNYETIKAGDAVLVMGYPAVAPDQFKITKSMDVFNRTTQVQSVPSPTVTPGSIGRVIRGRDHRSAGEFVSTAGDLYQLTINATGAGNSGGPLFDKEGKVIGIFNSGMSRGGASITLAIPIKYGLELMGRNTAQ